MIRYQLSDFGEYDSENAPRGTVDISTYEEWKEANRNNGLWRGIESILAGSRFSRVEDTVASYYGTLVFPLIHNAPGNKHRIGFWLTAEKLVLIDDGDFAQLICEDLAEKKYLNQRTAAAFLFEFLWKLTGSDDSYMEELRDEMYRMEENTLSGILSELNENLLLNRRALFERRSYYEQLIMLGERLEDNSNGMLEESDCRLFRLFAGRCTHLQSDAQMLLEYSVQIRDLYQSQMDSKQNSIIRMLTLVTSMFLPLSLVAAWYGMNFKYMPELSWKWSYPVLIAICAAIIGTNLYIFRRKGFFK